MTGNISEHYENGYAYRKADAGFHFHLDTIEAFFPELTSHVRSIQKSLLFRQISHSEAWETIQKDIEGISQPQLHRSAWMIPVIEHRVSLSLNTLSQPDLSDSYQYCVTNPGFSYYLKTRPDPLVSHMLDVMASLKLRPGDLKVTPKSGKSVLIQAFPPLIDDAAEADRIDTCRVVAAADLIHVWFKDRPNFNVETRLDANQDFAIHVSGIPIQEIQEKIDKLAKADFQKQLSKDLLGPPHSLQKRTLRFKNHTLPAIPVEPVTMPGISFNGTLVTLGNLDRDERDEFLAELRQATGQPLDKPSANYVHVRDLTPATIQAKLGRGAPGRGEDPA